MEWDLNSGAADLIRALSAVSEGFCPDCRVPVGEYGRCTGCGASWRAGHARGGEPWLEYRSGRRPLSVTWFPYVIASVA